MDPEVLALMQETVDRTRRVETKLTRWLTSIGFDIGARKPIWRNSGDIDVPSPATSFADIQAVIPADWPRDDPVFVSWRGDCVGYVLKP